MISVAGLRCFADDSGEVVTLKQQVKDLTDKLANLEGKVTTMEGHISAAPGKEHFAAGPVVPPGEPTKGGLIHTMQDIHMGGYIDVEYNQNLTRQTTNNAAGVIPSVTNGVATATSQSGGNISFVVDRKTHSSLTCHSGKICFLCPEIQNRIELPEINSAWRGKNIS